MAKQMRVGVKQALITGLFLIAATVLGVLLTNSKKDKDKIKSNQNIKEQKVDTGSINNYNAGRDVKIENNTFNGVSQKDTFKDNLQQKNVPMNSRPKNQIINNAPNQGVQINENNGTVIVPKPMARNFTTTDAKKILKDYPTNYPVEIWLKGTTDESKLFFDKVVGSFQRLGYANISTNVVAIYINSVNGKKENQKDLEWKEENGKLLVSIYPQE